MTEYLFYQTDNQTKDSIVVKPSNYYEPGLGYGFFTEKSAKSSHSLSLPELNTGFVPAPEFQQEIQIKQDDMGCYVDSQSLLAQIPLSFKGDVSNQGNFLLTITLYSEEEEEVLLFVGRRQLVFRGNLKPKEEWSGSFPVSVCDFIPRGETDRFSHQEVEVTVISKSVHMKKLKVETRLGKTIYLAGDSTVTDQSAEYPYTPSLSYGGWGQMLPAFLDGVYGVSNHSHSGLTTESFRTEGHYNILMEQIKSGDICLFQFGHNDQKLDHLKAPEGYRVNLIQYIKEVREKGAIAVLVTPLARNSWAEDGSVYHDLLKEYAEEVVSLGRAMSVPVVDLHGKSMELIKEYGLEGSKQWFYPLDYTHTNDYGAWKMAGYVFKELVDLCVIDSERSEVPLWETPKENAWLSYEKGEHL
jgi:lysophospholipase L1-like esterase